jgi:tetratricopeptide (TPR) repeat protein
LITLVRLARQPFSVLSELILEYLQELRQSFRRINLRLASRGTVLLALSLLGTQGVKAQQNSVMNMPVSDGQAAANNEVTGKLLQGMGNWHHPITAKNEEAQKFFDQGLTLVYAFNFDEAKCSFQRASQLDPTAAMPYWGLALTVGPSYNGGTFVHPVYEKEGYEALQHAKKLAAVGPENERAYINALSKLFSVEEGADPAKLAHDYIPAARELRTKYPDDPDAATLYGAILMDLHTKKLWTSDGAPTEDTLEIIAVFEDVLRRWPDHPGANHLYIHTMEASPYAERALPSARRLENLVPAAGHLVHMPAHIYIRTGEYSAAVKSNEEAIAADRSYFRDLGTSNRNYKFSYAEHNYSFLTAAAEMSGEYEPAEKAAKELAADAAPLLSDVSYVEGYMVNQFLVPVRFAKWNDVLAIAAPDAKLKGLTLFWHYARGCAFAAKRQTQQAEAELDAMEKVFADIPAGPAFGMMPNTWSTMHDMAQGALSARIAEAHGDYASAIEKWRAAISVEDHMVYHEPPDWYYPIRESLGATFLRAGQPAEAEKVFRDDLTRNPRSPRSLFGLWKALEAEQKPAGADWARRSFEAAWRGAPNQLRIEDF